MVFMSANRLDDALLLVCGIDKLFCIGLRAILHGSFALAVYMKISLLSLMDGVSSKSGVFLKVSLSRPSMSSVVASQSLRIVPA